MNNMKIAIFACLYLALISGSTHASEVSLEQVKQFNLREGKVNSVAMEVFFYLREKFGMRLRTSGTLIYCKKPKLAAEIQPSIFELMSESLDLLDTMDMTQYGFKENSDRSKATVSRRAVTAATAYIFSADEHAQSIVRLFPSHKATLCKTAMTSYAQILEINNSQ